MLAGVGIQNLDDAHAAARGLKGLGVADPVVTLGPAGAVCFDHGRTVHVPAPQDLEAVETTGAGDAFVGALACFLREGVEMAEGVAARRPLRGPGRPPTGHARRLRGPRGLRAGLPAGLSPGLLP